MNSDSCPRLPSSSFADTDWAIWASEAPCWLAGGFGRMTVFDGNDATLLLMQEVIFCFLPPTLTSRHRLRSSTYFRRPDRLGCSTDLH